MQIEARFMQIDARFTQIDGRFDALDAKMSRQFTCPDSASSYPCARW